MYATFRDPVHLFHENTAGTIVFLEPTNWIVDEHVVVLEYFWANIEPIRRHVIRDNAATGATV